MLETPQSRAASLCMSGCDAVVDLSQDVRSRRENALIENRCDSSVLDDPDS